MMLESLFLQLEQHDVISDAERALLAETISTGRDFAVGQDLVSAGSRPTYSTLLVEGLAARYKVLEDGGRQFTSLQVPGDFVDLHAFLLKTMDHGIVALSPCRVLIADHNRLRTITETAPISRGFSGWTRSSTAQSTANGSLRWVEGPRHPIWPILSANFTFD